LLDAEESETTASVVLSAQMGLEGVASNNVGQITKSALKYWGW
jgi:hypothetical protein